MMNYKQKKWSTEDSGFRCPSIEEACRSTQGRADTSIMTPEVKMAFVHITQLTNDVYMTSY